VSYLLDASVWLAAADLDDALHEAALDLVRSENIEHAALDLTVYEVGNVAARRWNDVERARRLCVLVFAACRERLMRVDAGLAEEAVLIAGHESLTVYDAAYVAAARREGHVLVSGDLKHLVRPGLALAPDAVQP
jgi:predicted nucleic acid-binding protein